MTTPKTLINVCGSERSGSTMLDLMLGNDPEAFSCGEVYALYRPWRRHHFRPECACGRECAYLEAFKKTPQERFHRLLFEEFGFTWVVDSSKDLTWVIDNQQWAVRDGRRVLNLLIWKEPATFSLSFLKRGRMPDHWRPVFLGYYRKFLESGIPFVSLCYDDFVRAPEEHLAALCSLSGMDCFEGKARFWEKEHHHLFGSGGTARQVTTGDSEIFGADECPPEYAGHLERIREKLRNDREVGAVIEAIRGRNLTALAPDHPGIFNDRWPGTVRKPLWYFREKLVLRLRGRFPDTLS